jgi:hypothetical protein
METCRGIDGGGIYRHDELKKCLARLVRERGRLCVEEPRLGGKTARRGDLSIPSLQDGWNGPRCIVDVSVASVGSEDIINKNQEGLRAATRRETLKHSEYEATLGKDRYLVAAVFESTGALGKGVQRLLNAIRDPKNASDAFVIGRQLVTRLHQANGEVIMGFATNEEYKALVEQQRRSS